MVDAKWRMVIDDGVGVNSDEVGSPVFSPDGRHIAYGARIGDAWYMVVDSVMSTGCRALNSKPLFSAGSKKISEMDTDYALLPFNDTPRRARNAYRQFVQEGIGQGRLPGLGGGTFVQKILKEAEKKQIRQPKLRRTGRTIAGIIQKKCRRSKVSAEELKRGNRRRKGFK